MRTKKVFYCELAYIIGIVILALGTAFMEKADFGMSMVVAPVYLLHLKVSEYLPFFSFGMSEYVFQALLLVLLSLVMKKVKRSYFLSFVTAFVYGILLDCLMRVVAFVPCSGIIVQIIFFIVGILACTFGIALLFHAYFPPEAYELVVKEFSAKFNISIGKMKTIYDYCSCVLGIVLSLCFFGTFIGISWGTIVCTVLNGYLIGQFGRLLESKFVFKDALALREKMK